MKSVSSRQLQQPYAKLGLDERYGVAILTEYAGKITFIDLTEERFRVWNYKKVSGF
jgi:hypothetical protein